MEQDSLMSLIPHSIKVTMEMDVHYFIHSRMIRLIEKFITYGESTIFANTHTPFKNPEYLYMQYMKKKNSSDVFVYPNQSVDELVLSREMRVATRYLQHDRMNHLTPSIAQQAFQTSAIKPFQKKINEFAINDLVFVREIRLIEKMIRHHQLQITPSALYQELLNLSPIKKNTRFSVDLDDLILFREMRMIESMQQDTQGLLDTYQQLEMLPKHQSSIPDNHINDDCHVAKRQRMV